MAELAGCRSRRRSHAVVVLIAMAILPSFHEVPGPLTGPDRLLLDGFPAEVLAEFWVYSLANQVLMWLAIGAIWRTLASRWRAASVSNVPSRVAR